MKNDFPTALLIQLGATRGQAKDAVDSAAFYLMHAPNQSVLISDIICSWVNYIRSPGGEGIKDPAAFICSRVKRLRQPVGADYTVPDDLRISFSTVQDLTQEISQTLPQPALVAVVRRS
jgi:hypothetical protein